MLAAPNSQRVEVQEQKHFVNFTSPVSPSESYMVLLVVVLVPVGSDDGSVESSSGARWVLSSR